MSNQQRPIKTRYIDRSHKKRFDTAGLKSRINTADFYTKETGFTVPDIRGKWFSTICPFHKDKKPSLRVYIPGGGFSCMACGEHGGDIITFVQKKHSLGFKGALKYLWQHYGSGS